MDVLVILAALSAGVLSGIGATIAFSKYGKLTTALREVERGVYETLHRDRGALETQMQDDVRSLHARIEELERGFRAEQEHVWREVQTLSETQKAQAIVKKPRRKAASKRKTVRPHTPSEVSVVGEL